MKNVTIFCICYFLCFSPIQVVFANTKQLDDIFLKTRSSLDGAIQESLFISDNNPKNFDDWRKKILSFRKVVELLVENKQEFSKNDCNSTCEHDFCKKFLEKILDSQDSKDPLNQDFYDKLMVKLSASDTKNSTSNPKQFGSLENFLERFLIFTILLTILLAVVIFTDWKLPFMEKKQKSQIQRQQMKNKPKEETANNVDIPEQPNSQLPTMEDRSDGDTTTSVVINEFWRVMGASVIGRSHLDNNPPLPCQDSHYLEEEDGKKPKWGVAVVCDGAGSATHSHRGSQFVAEKTSQFFKKIVKKLGWYKGILPTQEKWHDVAKKVLAEVRHNLESYANEKNIEIKELACTVIVIIFSPAGLLVTHIGDGRGGYRNDKGEWKSFLTPFKGEEANQTVFITSNIWNDPDKYIESRIITERSTAFVLMSDGCESHCFQTYNPDKTSEQLRLIDVNTPHSKFFEPLFNTIQAMEVNESEELRRKWADFIQSGTEGLKNEPDDKTMIIGVFKV